MSDVTQKEGGAITLIVPTRNRCHTLAQVAESYYRQRGVSEIIFVDDAGSDGTGELVARLGRQHTDIRTQLITNPRRLGAAQSRNAGVTAATNEFVLFCDDDEHLQEGYAETCLRKLVEGNLAAISGRRIYLREGEAITHGLRRFGNGLRYAKPFNEVICEYVNGAIFAGDIELPFTNAVILTRRSLLQRYPFDPHYATGNGYREETDYQMNLYVHDHRIGVTNDCHSFHLPPSQIRKGGQTTKPLRRIYWSVYYTNYFFGKYYAAYAKRRGMATPRWLALVYFTGFALYREFLRPLAYPAALWLSCWWRDRHAAQLRQG
jgi:glycosyltransferase involved in cell wall biosynthesis